MPAGAALFAPHTVAETLAPADHGSLPAGEVASTDAIEPQWGVTSVVLAGPVAEENPPESEALASIACDPVPAIEAASVAVEPASAEAPATIAELAGEEQTIEVAENAASPVADESAPPLAEGSALPVAEEPGLAMDTEVGLVGDSAMDSRAGTDGASLAHALGDLWQEAGVAPPLDVPCGSPAASPAGHGPVAALQSMPASAETPSPPAYGVAAPRAVGSFAARAQAQEKVSPRRVVRAVGMVVSGLLAIGLTYGVFKLFGWGTRPRAPRPAATQKAEGAQPQAPRPGKTDFVPDWKGLKPLDKR